MVDSLGLNAALRASVMIEILDHMNRVVASFEGTILNMKIDRATMNVTTPALILGAPSVLSSNRTLHRPHQLRHRAFPNSKVQTKISPPPSNVPTTSHDSAARFDYRRHQRCETGTDPGRLVKLAAVPLKERRLLDVCSCSSSNRLQVYIAFRSCIFSNT